MNTRKYPNCISFLYYVKPLPNNTQESEDDEKDIPTSSKDKTSIMSYITEN